jgi:predicted transcriptional regulator
METQYITLQTIYAITKDDLQPETYKCRPREIILRQYQDWSVIQQHLKLLEEEGLVITNQEDTLVISITHAGIEKIKEDKIFTTSTN